MKIEENKTGWVITPETNTEVLVSQIVIDLLNNAHVFENIELVIQDIANKAVLKAFTPSEDEKHSLETQKEQLEKLSEIYAKNDKAVKDISLDAVTPKQFIEKTT
jgi:hypothetical protein